MSKPRVLSAAEVSSKDLMVMRSLIRLMSAELDSEWRLEAGTDGDVVITDVDSEAGSALWESLSRDGESPIALTRKRDFPARHVMHKPLRSRQLISVLNELSGGGKSAPERAGVKPMVLGLKPDSLPLAEHLRRRTWSTPVVFEGWQKPAVVIDPGSGAWYSSGSLADLDGLLSANLGPDSATPLSSAGLVEKTAGMDQHPLADLKWAAGLRQSSAGVHPDLVGEASFMLTHIPRQARQTEAHHELARALTGGPGSLEDLAAGTGHPPDAIARFLNACYACGFLLVRRGGSAR